MEKSESEKASEITDLLFRLPFHDSKRIEENLLDLFFGPGIVFLRNELIPRDKLKDKEAKYKEGDKTIFRIRLIENEALVYGSGGFLNISEGLVQEKRGISPITPIIFLYKLELMGEDWVVKNKFRSIGKKYLLKEDIYSFL